MKVLVTGATGIVGTNLVRALLEASHQVRVLVRPSSDVRSLAKLPVERREGDILDLASLIAAASGCSVIFHAAAVFSYWGMSAEINATSRNADAQCPGSSSQKPRATVVVTSSSVVLGSTARGQVLDETSATDEPDPSSYTRSKMAQEAAAFRRGEELGVDVVAVARRWSWAASTTGSVRATPTSSTISMIRFGRHSSAAATSSRPRCGRGHMLAAERGKTGARYVLGSENLTGKTPIDSFPS